MKNVLHSTGHELKLPDIVNSDGAYVYDSRGRQYADLASGVWCTALGHHHPRISRVMTRQADRLMHAGFCYSNPILERAAESVLSVTGLAHGRCVFLCSGSEAIEYLRQAATHLGGRQKTLALHDAYLGSYSSVTRRDRDWHIVNWESCADCPKNDQCDPDCPTIREIPGDISEFLFEPGSASGFVRFPPVGLVHTLAALVRESGGYVIANEVTTGMGRTGKWFGFQHYGIEPDMAALGKGLGNGYPVSAAAVSQAVAAGLEGGGFKYAQSHQNDPLGAAIAMAVIQTMTDEALVMRAAELGRQFLEQLQGLVDGEVVLAVRGKGLMFGIDLAGPDMAGKIQDQLLEKGFIVCNRGALFRIDPPLITEPDIFQGFIEAFADAAHTIGRKSP